MSRRDDDPSNELAEWLAGLGEQPSDEDAALPTDPPTVPTDPPTVPTHPPTVPAPDLGAGDHPPGIDPFAESASAPGGDAGEEHPRSARRLWMLAALPWLAVVAIALAVWWDLGAAEEPAADGEPAPATTSVDAQPDRSNGGSEPGGRPAVDDTVDAAGEATAPLSGTGEAVPGELAATAEAAVRTMAAGQLATAEDAAVHVGYARATAAIPLGDDAVVTVAALVRRAAGDHWGAPQPARFAVPLDDDGRVREPPWPLPSGDPLADDLQPAALDPVDLDAAEELVDAAGRALTGAGYDTPQVQALHRVGDDRALRVEAVTQPPGASQRSAVVAWLTPDADRVLGQRAEPDAAEPDEPAR